MNLNRLTNELLYVPYSHEYTVCPEIKEKMTLDDFFSECFVMPDFRKEIDIISNLIDESVDDPEYLLTKQDLIRRYKDCLKDQNNFQQWMRYHGSDVYCITGDAGTGKTTYIHYLQYKYSEFDWEIIDVQKAVSSISFMGYMIKFSSFDLLVQKISSAILLSICKDIYTPLGDGSINYSAMRQAMLTITTNYSEYVKRYHPDFEIANIFDQLNQVIDDTREMNDEYFCTSLNSVFFRCIQNLFCFQEQKTYIEHLYSMEKIIKFYLVFLRCKSKVKKHIITFDNIERYIGTDEIYNKEIIDMVQALRHTHDEYYQQYCSNNKDRFAENFQFLVLMRNTSTRMFTPQQNSDFLQSTMDISEWFSVNEIVKKKISWYKENQIVIQECDELLAMLDDFGCAGERIRGLRTKLDLLFNSNKRLILDFINNMCDDPDYQKKLKEIDFYRKNKAILEYKLTKFATRTIMWKSIINRLMSTEQFSFMCSTDSGNAISFYCYSILTILANYALKENGDITYMPFSELIEELYQGVDNAISYFFDPNNKLERKKVGEILFNMNYFDRRHGRWFQFIDIQYNMNAVQSLKITNSDELINIIEDSKNDIHSLKIRIMNSGKAFVWYIIHSYEFFSTKYHYLDSLLSDIVPLVETPLLTVKTTKIMSHIHEVANATFKYIEEYNNEANGRKYLLKKSINDRGHTLSERVFNSQIGYIGNVHECLIRILKSLRPVGGTEVFLQQMEKSVSIIKDSYRSRLNF